MNGKRRLNFWVSPNARRNEISGVVEGVIRMRLHAPPIDGKANEALLRFVADRLNLPKNAVELIAGHTARRKIVEVSDASRDTVELIAALLPSSQA